MRVAVLVLVAGGIAGSAPPPDETIGVVASRSGFKPARIELRRGEAARLSLSTADEEHCFAVDAFRVEKRVVPGRATLLDLTPDRAGTFAYYCCLHPEAEKGRLVVAE